MVDDGRGGARWVVGCGGAVLDMLTGYLWKGIVVGARVVACWLVV